MISHTRHCASQTFKTLLCFNGSRLSTVGLPTLSTVGLPTLSTAGLPTITLYRSISLKPKLKEFVNCDYVDSMGYGVYALTTGYIKEAAMEAGRIAIVRKAKTKEVWKVVSETPFTKKPLGTRMGKGKGKLDYWASKAIAGQVLFEFNCENDSLANEAFKQLKAKLPVRLHLRIKPKNAKTFLSVEEFLEMVKLHEDRKVRLHIE